MSTREVKENILLQSSHHPLVSLTSETPESHCLSLIHQKAYARAAEMATSLSVLDIGCNNGHGTLALAKTAREVIGVDVSPDAVQAARKYFCAENLKYSVVDGMTLPFPDRRFDMITSFQVIEHVYDVKRYLFEIRRVLKHSGCAILTTPNRCIRLDPGMKPWNRFHVREYSAVELEQVLGSVFREVVIEGLFATSGLYEVELNRVTRAREAARRSKATRLLGRGFRATKSALHLGIKQSAQCQKEPLALKWTLSDLFYCTECLDEALDLFACVR